jgi:hypothetical protein
MAIAAALGQLPSSVHDLWLTGNNWSADVHDSIVAAWGVGRGKLHVGDGSSLTDSDI